MADWRNKFSKSSNQEEPEDFILLREDAEAAKADTAEQFSAEDIRRSMEDTGEIPVISDDMTESSAGIYADYAPKHSEEEKTERIGYDLDVDGVSPLIRKNEREPGFKGFVKEYKKWLIGSGITVAAAALIVALFFALSALTDPMRGYAQAEVVKGNVIHAMPAEGTLTANARYSITSLVSGKVTESKPEVGDKVSAGTVLYKLDDTEAKLAVERAKNQLSKSKAAGATAATGSDKIYSTSSGTVHTVNIRSGGVVSYGQVVCTIKKSDDSVVAVTSPVAGTVSSVNVSQGSNVSVNSLIASVTSAQTGSNQKTSVYDQKSNELDVKMAESQLENYTIKSPVSGVVIEKNTKVGDNVGITNMENPMMVILDNSSLKFTFRVDEYTLNELETGLDVIVNTESIPEESFAGVITRIGSEGTANDEGKVMFEVDVTVDEPGDLKSGMKVTAKVILESATNVMYVPHQALMEADGENAVILVKDNSSGTITPTAGIDEALAYPWIQIPEGCRLVTVKYGVGDGTNVEIISGLNVGDIVVYNPEAELVDLNPAPTEEEESEDDATVPAVPAKPDDEEERTEEATGDSKEASKETSKPKESTKPKGTQSL